MNLFDALFNTLRFAPLIIIIGYAALSDRRCGEVANKVWLYTPFGLLLTITSIYLQPETAYPALLSITATTVLALALFYLGGWGGADSKAFLTIAACMPITPFNLKTPIPMYPLAIVFIAAILSFIGGLKQKNTPWMKRQVRFLPYTLPALFIALLV